MPRKGRDRGGERWIGGEGAGVGGWAGEREAGGGCGMEGVNLAVARAL